MATRNKRKFNNNKRACDRTDFRKSGAQDKSSDDDFKSSQRQSGRNDVSWYSVDPSLVAGTANIPFNWAVGTDIKLNADNNANAETGEHFKIKVADDYIMMPGVCAVRLAPAVGLSDSANSALNVAATATYSYVRHANSGHANYDSPDLMLYIMAMTQVYSYINFLQRAYGCMTLYAQRNRYLPKALLKAMGLDYDDLAKSLASFRYYINLFINQAASLAVPADMSIFMRHAFLYSNVYTGGTSIKDQLYLYVPDGFWVYQEGTESHPEGMLVYKPWVDVLTASAYNNNEIHPATLDDIIAFGNSMLQPILGSEDMNIMSGDILKAYGSNILKLQILPEQYPIVPVFNIGVLEQIKNAHCMPVEPASLNIEQSEDKSYLVFKPYITQTVTADNGEKLRKSLLAELASMNSLLTTSTADATPDLVLESTRLMAVVKPENKSEVISGADHKRLILCGSEIATKVYFIRYGTPKERASGHEYEIRENLWIERHASGVNDYQEDTPFIRAHFRFAPMLVLYSYSKGSASVGTVEILGLDTDIDNYAVLTWQDLFKLHEAVIMNMLHVPSIAKLQ